MPRGGSRSRSPPSRSTNTATRPMPQKTTPPPTQTQQSSGTGLMGGLGGMVMQGMAFGAGSEVAHQAVRGIMGSGSGSHQQQEVQQQPPPPQQQQQQQNPCQLEVSNFSECLQRNSDIGYCQHFSDMLKNCKQTNGLI